MGFPTPWPHGYIPSSTSVAGTALAYRTDVLDKSRSRLLQQFLEKPRMQALVEVISAPWQDLELATWQLYAERTLDTAVAHALRILAHLVGIRGYDSSTDSLLRRFTRAAIAATRSSGGSEDLILVTKVFASSTLITLRPYWPGAIIVQLGAPLDAPGYEAMLLGRLLRRAATGGVRLVFQFAIDPLEDTFRFSSSSTDTELSDRVGFADDGNTIGGALMGATNGMEG